MIGQIDSIVTNAIDFGQGDKAVLPASDKSVWCQEFLLICQGSIFLICPVFCMDCNGMRLYFQVVNIINFNSGNGCFGFADVFCLCI